MEKFELTDLVSIEYLPFLVKYNQAGHGSTGVRKTDDILHLICQEIEEDKCESALDYGCGQGTLAKAVKKKISGFVFDEYDPAVPGKSSIPDKKYDIVICTDVLEHIEPDKLDNVLAHIASLVKKRAYFVIATRPAILTLSDGRNAHLIIKSGDWWLEKLHTVFPEIPIITNFSEKVNEVTILVEKWAQMLVTE